MATQDQPLVFTVTSSPELIRPAKPTSHEYKLLSDIDDQEGLHFQIPIILFYQNKNHVQKMDPVRVIRRALSKTLVFYYPLAHARKLVKKVKEDVTEEYMKSLADLMVLKGRPHYSTSVRIYAVLDVRHAGFGEVDFGWGKPAYGGPDRGEVMVSSYISVKNKKGENGTLVPVYLPSFVMERFVVELDSMLKNNDQSVIGNTSLSS